MTSEGQTRRWRLAAPPAPWGDYGQVLRDGLATPVREEGRLVRVELERTGPFAPPISFPFGAIVVTDTLRQGLEQAGFTGVAFTPAPLIRVVKLDWTRWDPSAEEPLLYPAGADPENYVLARRHNPTVAEAMPKFWAFAVAQTSELQVLGGFDYRAALDPGEDAAACGDLVWVSARLKAWLEEAAGAWVAFQPARGV